MPLSSLSEAELDALADRFISKVHQTSNGNGNGNGRVWSRNLNLTVAIFVIAGMLISAGITLSRVGTVDEQTRENRQAIVDLSKDLEAVRAKQAEAEGNTRVINEKLNTIISEIAELKGQAYANRR